MVEEGVRRFGALHVLHNNAGVLWKDRDRSVLETDDRWWDRVMAINLKSVFWVTKYGIPHLQRAGGGSIINMGSVSALAGFTRAQDAYAAAKGAVPDRRDPQGVRDRHPARAHRAAARDRVRRVVPGQRRIVVHDRGGAGRRRRLHRRIASLRPSIPPASSSSAAASPAAASRTTWRSRAAATCCSSIAASGRGAPRFTPRGSWASSARRSRSPASTWPASSSIAGCARTPRSIRAGARSAACAWPRRRRACSSSAVRSDGRARSGCP
jgi:short subunit dehydrogenase